MICKTCHISLSKPKPTMSKHALSVHENILKNCKCIICEKEVDEKITQEFHIQEYNKNTPQLKKLLQNSTVEEINGKICKYCHVKLQCHSLVKCEICQKEFKRYNTVIAKNNGVKQCVCKPCNSTLVGHLKCIVCNTSYPKHRTIQFRITKYNMNNDIVKTILQCPFIESESICIQCDQLLVTTNVCTCCHGKFHLNGVIIFHQENYNFENYIVSHALASQNQIINGDTEYICKTCHKNLEENNNHIPSMPKNAVAHKKQYLAVSFCKQYVKNLNLFVHAVTDGCFKKL